MNRDPGLPGMGASRCSPGRAGRLPLGWGKCIWPLDSQGNTVDLLVNEIGPFDGSTAVGIQQSENYLLNVTADGNWTVTIEE